jgi:hypothetical protein
VCAVQGHPRCPAPRHAPGLAGTLSTFHHLKRLPAANASRLPVRGCTIDPLTDLSKDLPDVAALSCRHP